MSRSVNFPGPNLSHSGPELLIRNLRLLSLDEEIDYPNIELDTFDVKDAADNQKQRIQAAEWLFYKLFTIWDRKNTQEVRNSSQIQRLMDRELMLEVLRHYNITFLRTNRYILSICAVRSFDG